MKASEQKPTYQHDTTSRKPSRYDLVLAQLIDSNVPNALEEMSFRVEA
jgi:hypothetical protein